MERKDTKLMSFIPVNAIIRMQLKHQCCNLNKRPCSVPSNQSPFVSGDEINSSSHLDFQESP